MELTDDIITKITIVRGAPCAATWESALKMIGLNVDDAIIKIGIETQYFCTADPSNWDPIYQKSPVHLAGEIHSKALKTAIEKKKEK